MDEEVYTKLTIEEACGHKVWKARLCGYERAAKHFQTIDDEKSPEWNKYIGLVKKFVVDNHALCQEKGLEAVLIFVENSAYAGSTTGDVVSGIIQKCLAAPKARTRELAAQVILMYIEIEKYEMVFEELIKGTESKNPKVAAACINVLSKALKDFGIKIINVSKLMKHVPNLLDDRDANVRSEAKILVCVLYHWLGPVIKPQLTAMLKPVQLAEIETEYEKVKDIPPKSSRMLRSQQTEKINVSVPDEDIEETENEVCCENETETYDQLEPVDIISKLDKNFFIKLESKKWSERKEVLEELEKQLTITAKLEPADYNEIIRAIKKVITKDSNIVVVGIAIKCVTGIANGLKKFFHQYVHHIIPALFEKFKEKKQNIVAALREAVDAVYVTTDLETILEDIVSSLDNKNPSIKSEISGFLSRCFSKSSPNTLTKKLLKTLCKSLINGLRDQDPTVRDNSALALGTAMKVVGEKMIGPFLVEIDPQMLKKIKGCSEQVKILLKRPGQKNTSEEAIIKKQTSVNTLDQVYSQTHKGKGPSNELENEIICNKSKFDISNQITDQLIAELGDKNWVVRAKAVAKLQDFVNSAQLITGSLGEAAPLIAARISDTNTKISASTIALVKSLALAMGPPFKKYIRIFLPPLMKMIGDSKIWIRSAVIPCFNTWGDVCGFKEFFEGEIIAEALKTGSITVRCELWSWLANLLPNIPCNRIKKEELIPCLPILYSNLEDKNFEVRKNACDAVLGFMLHLGFTNMIRAWENIKGSSCSQVKLILEKTRGSLPVQPLLQLKPIGRANGKAMPLTTSLSPESSATIINPNLRGNMTLSKSTNSMKNRTQKGSLLQVNSQKTQRIIDEQKLKTLQWNFVSPTPEFVDFLREQMLIAKVDKTLVAHMFHNDFRYHIRAIDALTNDLTLNKAALISNLDLILRWITLRFFDTNPSVLLKGLEYLNSVFNVLIEEEYIMTDTEASSFFPYLIPKLGNPKDSIRNNVLAILKRVSTVYPANKQFFYVMEGLKSKNTRQRIECLEQLSWLIHNYGISVYNPSPSGALKEIAKYISDRDTTVRNTALNCLITAYSLEGDKILKWIGLISEKNLLLLEEKIKKVTKRPPTNIVKPLIIPPIEVSGEQEQQEEVIQVTRACNAKDKIESSQIFTTASSINGKYALDHNIINEIECKQAQFQAPKLVNIDLNFLKDQTQRPLIKSILMPKMSTIPSSYSQPAAIIHELLNIDDNNIERTMDALSRINNILDSDKWQHLTEFVDLIFSQLVHLITILNQCEHPEVINCYRKNFSLFQKLCNQPDLCSKITEVTLYKILEQVLYLLSEPQSDKFATYIYNLEEGLLKNSNKTNILCASLKILYSTINNLKATNHYNDLVVTWIETLTKSLSEWDSDLDYSRILYEFQIFLNNYPTTWWNNEVDDFPLRTTKTLIYTMVKNRGTEVREIFKKMPSASKDSELYDFIKKTIKKIKMEEDSKTFLKNGNKPKTIIPRLSKEIKNELSEIFRMIANLDQTPDGIRRLFEFKKSHPEAELQTFITKATPQFQQFINRGLQALEKKYVECSNNRNKDKNGKDIEGAIGKENLTEEAKVIWNRLQCLQEKLGGQFD